MSNKVSCETVVANTNQVKIEIRYSNTWKKNLKDIMLW